MRQQLQTHSADGRIARHLFTMLLALCAGCSTLPASAPRASSLALPAHTDSALVRIARASTPGPDVSGVRLLPLGLFSFDARVELIRRAQRSLDVQYYVLDDDATGHRLLNDLVDAAERGVRVRLLVDDLYTTHTHRILAMLATWPNVQVHLFNPFCCARDSGFASRFGVALLDFERLNHRMHNKLFIADGAFAVVGGRNIADEYFQRGNQASFIDMDALVAGAVMPDLSSIFDVYWNSPQVRPIQSIEPLPARNAESIASFRAQLNRFRDQASPELPTVDVLGYGPIGDEFDVGRIGLIWGRATAMADPPDKVERDMGAAFSTSLAKRALMKIWEAKAEVVVTSPYFIPGPNGIKAIQEMAARRVKMTVLTNSLAATDEPLVHVGYSRYRQAMVDAGVDLYELSPSRSIRSKRLGLASSSSGRLHAKTAVIDRREVFIGSMNLDPRSRTQNTEIGIFVESPALAREMLRVINISRLQGAYRVRQSPDHKALQWLTFDDEKEMVLDQEPESDLWLHLQNILFGWFVPEQLL